MSKKKTPPKLTKKSNKKMSINFTFIQDILIKILDLFNLSILYKNWQNLNYEQNLIFLNSFL